MRQIEKGDLFSIKIDKGYIYFQFIYRDAALGHLIRVLPGIWGASPDNYCKIVAQKELFFVFFPVPSALKKGIIEKVGNYEIPENSQMPNFMREPYNIGKNGTVLDWKITNMVDGTFILIDKLNPEQKKLSLRLIYNDTYLIDRIRENWKLEEYY